MTLQCKWGVKYLTDYGKTVRKTVYHLLQVKKMQYQFKPSNVFSIVNFVSSAAAFGLKKFFVPLLIGAQVFKSILLAMFLPSILGSFGKILGKGEKSLPKFGPTIRQNSAFKKRLVRSNRFLNAEFRIFSVICRGVFLLLQI